MPNNLLDLGRDRVTSLFAGVPQDQRAALQRAIQNLPPAQFQALQRGERSGFDAVQQAMGGGLDRAGVSTTLGGDRKPSSVWKGLTNPATLGFLAAPIAASALFPAAGAAAAAGAAGTGAAGAAGTAATAGGIGSRILGWIGNNPGTAAGIGLAGVNALSGRSGDADAARTRARALMQTPDREDLSDLYSDPSNPYTSPRLNRAKQAAQNAVRSGY